MRNFIAGIFFAGLLCCISACKNAADSVNTAGVKDKEKVKQLLDIDPLKSSPDQFTLILENEKVRVLRYSLRPGEKDNWHTHPPKSAYIISGGKLKVYLENGQTIIAEEVAGTGYWSDYVGKHYVENIGTTEVTILLTEIK